VAGSVVKNLLPLTYFRRCEFTGWPKPDEEWPEGEVEIVDLDLVYSTQTYISEKRLEKCKREWESTGRFSALPQLQDYEGLITVLDGNHRLSVLKFLGESHVEARVVRLNLVRK